MVLLTAYDTPILYNLHEEAYRTLRLWEKERMHYTSDGVYLGGLTQLQGHMLLYEVLGWPEIIMSTPEHETPREFVGAWLDLRVEASKKRTLIEKFLRRKAVVDLTKAFFSLTASEVVHDNTTACCLIHYITLFETLQGTCPPLGLSLDEVGYLEASTIWGDLIAYGSAFKEVREYLNALQEIVDAPYNKFAQKLHLQFCWGLGESV